MKKFISLIIVILMQITSHEVFAQRNPSNEILVFFQDGVQQETHLEKGNKIVRSSIKSEQLKSSLKKMVLTN